jgi:hypothetical protein
MPSFDSPIGSKKVAGNALREFDVPDEEMEQQLPPAVVRHRQRANAQANAGFDPNSIREFQNRMNMENEQSDADIEREIRQAKEAKRSGKERLTDGAKRRIEMLLGMTRTVRNVQINENNFVLQTLKSKEMRDAITAASEFDNTVQSPFEIRRQFLSRSLVEVSGIPFDQFIGSNDLEARLAFIDELDDPLLNRLYDEYLSLVKEARDKYVIKTDEEAKEVVEDLKKS